MKKINQLFLMVILLAMTLITTQALAADTVKPEINEIYADKGSNSKKDLHVSFYLSEQAKVSINVYKGSKVVKNGLKNIVKPEGYVSWSWTGKKTDGDYVIKIDATDMAGNKAKTQSVKVKIDSVLPVISNIKFTETAFKPNGKNTKDISFKVSEAAYVSVIVYEIKKGEEENYVKWFEWQSKAPKSFKASWNGYRYPDVITASGTYEYRMIAFDIAGNRTEKVRKFEIINNSPPKLGALYLSSESIDETNDIHANVYFYLNKSAKVEIKAYKRVGDSNLLVRTVHNDKVKPGYHNIKWDSKDENGDRINAGNYFVEVKILDEASGYSKLYTTEEDFVVKNIEGIFYKEDFFLADGIKNQELTYILGLKAKVQVKVVKYNYEEGVNGEVVRNLFNSDVAPGPQKLTWDGRDDNGKLVPGYKLGTNEAGNEVVLDYGYYKFVFVITQDDGQEIEAESDVFTVQNAAQA